VLGRSQPQLKAIFPAAKSLIVADVGHFIQEDAGEEVAEHIRAWLEANPS